MLILFSAMSISAQEETSYRPLAKEGKVWNFLSERICYDQRVREFAEIPQFLLDSINTMGIDGIPVLNEFEGNYFNNLFKVDPQASNLIGKRICFLRGGSLKTKADYFNETRDRYKQNYSIIGGSALYVFDETQKKESGGYDAAIVYWSKFAIPMEDVIKRLKESCK
jgi:hypothetical protein